MAASASLRYMQRRAVAFPTASRSMRKEIFTSAVMPRTKSGVSPRQERNRCWRGIVGESVSAARPTWRLEGMISTSSILPISPGRQSRARRLGAKGNSWRIRRLFRMKRLEGKIAIVTGAGHGIGRAISEIYAAEGAVVFMCSLDPEAGEVAAAEFRQSGGDATFLPCDVSHPNEVARVVDLASKRNGRI